MKHTSMHQKLRRWLALCCLLAGAIPVAGQQTFPVQIMANLNLPHSQYLSDYGYAHAMNVNILLKGRVSYSGFLRIRLESIDGRGIVLQTRATYNPVVDLGPSQTFTGVELAPYFSQENLDFIGYNRQQFLRSKTIPTGLYRLTFSFYDRFRPDKLVSNRDILSQKTLRIFSINPPQINLPLQLSTVNPSNLSTQPVPINWTRPANTPFSPEYELIINELSPQCQEKYSGFTSGNAAASRISQGELFNCLGPEIYRTTTTALNYNYGMQAEPLLGLNKWYAARVQARDPQGRTLFTNNGVSQIRVFRYGKPCPVPPRVKVTALNPYQVQLDWDALPDHTGYTVYSKRQGERYRWHKQTALSNRAQVKGLEPGVYYSFRVTADCNAFSSKESASYDIRMPTPPPSKVQCGKPLVVDLSNRNPIQRLKVGDKVMAGDFEVTLLEVRPLGGGYFAGRGRTQLNVFQGAKIFVRFSRVKINTDRRLIEGEMESTGAGAVVVPEEWSQKYLSFTGEINRLFGEIEKGLDKVDALLGKIDEVLKKVEQWVQNYQGEDKQELLETIRIGKKEIAEGKKKLKGGDEVEGFKKLKDGSGKVLGVAGKMVKEKLNNFFKGLKKLLQEILKELKQEGKKLVGQKKEQKKQTLTEAVLLLESYNKIDSTAWINRPEGDDPVEVTSLTTESREMNAPEVKALKANINQNDPQKRLGKFVEVLIELEVENWNVDQIGETLTKNLQKLITSIKQDAPDFIKAISQDLLDGKDTQVIKAKLKAFVKKRFEEAKQTFLKEVKQRRN